MNLIEIAYYIGWGVLLIAALAGGWRVIAGPTTLDRMVGFDTMTVTVAGLVAMFSLHAGTSEYVELILIITSLGFFATVAYFYYLSQSKRDGGDDFNERNST